LSESREQAIEYLQDIVYHVKLDRSLPSNRVIHPACVETHEYRTAEDDKQALENVRFVARLKPWRSFQSWFAIFVNRASSPLHRSSP